MKELYAAPELKELFKKLATAVESLTTATETRIEMIAPVGQFERIPSAAFQVFCKKYGIRDEEKNEHWRKPSFILPVFKQIEEQYGTTRIKWWWHDGPLLYWFTRLRDDRLKLVLEIGPLEADERIAFIEDLEGHGMKFTDRSKIATAKYTRIYSNTKVINDWTDEAEVAEEMIALFEHPKQKKTMLVLERLS